jgi:hypothetical protein
VAALLAALFAPPATAASTATGGSAHRVAAAPSGRGGAKSTRPTPTRPAATTPAAGRQDMVKKPGATAGANHVRSGTTAASAGQANVTTGSRAAAPAGSKRPDVIDGRTLLGKRSAAGKRSDVIDGRDAAALRELYRKRKPATARSTRSAEATPRGEATRPLPTTRNDGRADERTGARNGGPRAEVGREFQGAAGETDPKAGLETKSGRQTPAVVTREPISAPASEPTHEEAPAVAQVAAPSDMVKKTGPKKQRRKDSQDEDEVVAAVSGPRPTATSGCAAGLGAAPALQFDRTRATLREFSWADMAYFFETAADEAEPEPRQVAREGTLPTEEAIRRSGLSRKSLAPLASAQAVDLLTERELIRVDKALAGATPAALATLLQADSPTLRAHVWTWLATTPAGACALVKLDGREVEAAIRDRSVAVEHGEDLVFRPLGDYALAARSRLAAADPQAYDNLLRTLWSEPGLDPRVRALVAGLRVRRGHADSIEAGLRDPVASIRGATAAAAIDRDRPRYEGRVLDHAADDPADLVTELIVGELLGGPDGVPRGELAESRDERVMAALSRWQGRGDPLSPLPVPDQPLRFPVHKKIEAAPPAAPAPMIAAAPEPAPVAPEPPAPAQAREDEEPVPQRPLAHSPARRDDDAPASSGLPSVLDDPDGAPLRP